MRRLVPLLLLLACSKLTLPVDEVVACGPLGECPDGMICTSDQTCWKPPPLPPPAPAALQVGVSGPFVVLTWKAAAGATSYSIDLRVSGATQRLAIVSATE